MNEDCISSFSNISSVFKKFDFQNDQDKNLAEVLKRFNVQKGQSENIVVLDENLKITHCIRENSLYCFPFDLPSYIIFEKYTEIDKPIGSINEWENTKVSSTPKSASKCSSKVSELEITGSPLSCQFLDLKSPDFDISQDIPEINFKRKFFQYSYCGLPLQNARRIVSKLRSILKVLKTEGIILPPVWVTCDGNDNSGIAFLGVNQSEVENSILTITHCGYFKEKDNLPTVEDLNSEFSIGSVLTGVKTKVKAIYEIVPQKLDKPCSTVDLHCRWGQTLSTLSSPSHDAEIVATFHLEIDDENSPANNLFTEFQVLHDFIIGYTEKCIKWSKIQSGIVIDRLEKYLNSYGNRDFSAPGKADLVLDLSKIVESKFLDIRSSKEFPEDIWDILKDCYCATELTDGFKIIFKSIANGMIRPRMRVKNETEFATICRNLMRGKGEIPSVEKWDAINMLIQIGLDKVKKDYMSIFQGCDLVNSEQLYYYARWNTSKTSYEECLKKLEKMLLVIQMVVLLKRTLNLPNAVLSHITTKTLFTMEKEKCISKDFEYQLETSLVKNIIDKSVPIIWVYEIESGCQDNPNFGKLLRFAVKKDEPFFKTSEKEEALQDSSSEMESFYCLSLSRVGDIF